MERRIDFPQFLESDAVGLWLAVLPQVESRKQLLGQASVTALGEYGAFSVQFHAARESVLQAHKSTLALPYREDTKDLPNFQAKVKAVRPPIIYAYVFPSFIPPRTNVEITPLRCSHADTKRSSLIRCNILALNSFPTFHRKFTAFENVRMQRMQNVAAIVRKEHL